MAHIISTCPPEICGYLGKIWREPNHLYTNVIECFFSEYFQPLKTTLILLHPKLIRCHAFFGFHGIAIPF